MSDDTASPYRYWAFISYSSKDALQARRLHKDIEAFRIPAKLIAHGHLTPVGEAPPAHFRPLFRDREELPAGANLGAAIKDALAASRYLIVLCSPYAAKSEWVNQEVKSFLQMGRADRVFTFIVDGEPNGPDGSGCYPPALHGKLEPLGADARPEGDGWSNAKLKLLAGMLGVGFDALKQRESQRRMRLLERVVLASLALILVFAGLTWYADQARRRAEVAEASAVAESHVRATAESNAVTEANARATAQAIADDRRREAEHQSTVSLLRQLVAQASTDYGETRLLTSATAARIALNSAITDTAAVYESLAASLSAGPLKFISHGDGDTGPAEFSPDGNRVATSGYDRWVRLWDATTGALIAAFPRGGPTFPAYGSVKAGFYEFSPDGSRLAVLDRDNVLHVVDTRDGKEVWREEITAEKLVLAFDSESRRMAVLDGATLRLVALSERMVTAELALGGQGEIAAFDFEGKRLALSDGGQLVQVVDAEQGKIAASVTITAPVKSLEFSSRGRWLFISDTSGALSVLGAADLHGDVVRPESRNPTCRDVSKDEKHVALGDKGGNLSILPAEGAGVTVALGAPLTRCEFAPDGSAILVTASAAMPPDGSNWQVLDLAGQRKMSIPRTLSTVVKAAFVPPGARLVLGFPDKSVTLLDGATLQALGKVPDGAELKEFKLYAGGARLAVIYGDGYLALYDTAKAAALLPLGRKDPSRWLDLDATESTLLVRLSYGDLGAIDALTGKLKSGYLNHHTDVQRACFLRMGAAVAVETGDGTELLDVVTGVERARLKGKWWNINSLCHDGAVVDGGVVGPAELWRLPSPGSPVTLSATREISGFVFGPDASWLAASAEDGRLHVWDLPSGLTRASVPLPDPSRGWTVQVTAGDARVGSLWSEHTRQTMTDPATISMPTPTAGPDGAYARPQGLWARPAENGSVRVLDGRTGGERYRLEHARGFSVTYLAFSPDGARLVTGGSDNTARVWDMSTGRQLAVLSHLDTVSGLAFDYSGRRLASADGWLHLWDMATFAEIGPLARKGRVDKVGAAPDGRSFLALGGSDPLTLHDFASGRAILALQTGWVETWAFSADGRYLATSGSGYENQVRVWDLATGGAEQARVSVRSQVYRQGIVPQLIFSPDGRWLARSGPDVEEGVIMAWPVRLDDLLTLACRTLSRNLSEAEWRLAMGDRPYVATCPGLPATGILLQPEALPPLHDAGSDTRVIGPAETVHVPPIASGVDLLQLSGGGNLELFDPTQARAVTLLSGAPISTTRPAPAGQRAAFLRADGEAGLLTWQADRGSVSVELTTLGKVSDIPYWSGGQLVYRGTDRLYRTLDASGTIRTIERHLVTAVDWSADGRYVAYLAGGDLWVEAVAGPRWKVAEGIDTIMWSPTRTRLALGTMTSTSDVLRGNMEGHRTYIFDPRYGHLELVTRYGYPTGWETDGARLSIVQLTGVTDMGAAYTSYLWNDERSQLVTVDKNYWSDQAGTVMLGESGEGLRQTVDFGSAIASTPDRSVVLVIDGDLESEARRLYFYDTRTDERRLLIEQLGPVPEELNPWLKESRPFGPWPKPNLGLDGSLSPQGNWALIRTEDAAGMKLYLAQLPSGSLRELSYLAHTSFSPDEHWLLGRDDKERWVVVELATGRMTRTGAAKDSEPQWWDLRG